MTPSPRPPFAGFPLLFPRRAGATRSVDASTMPALDSGVYRPASPPLVATPVATSPLLATIPLSTARVARLPAWALLHRKENPWVGLARKETPPAFIIDVVDMALRLARAVYRVARVQLTARHHFMRPGAKNLAFLCTFLSCRAIALSCTNHEAAFSWTNHEAAFF